MTIVSEIEDVRWNALSDVMPQLERVVAMITDNHSEINLLLTNDIAMQEINKCWRGVDKPTNVLSFPAAAMKSLPPDAPHPLGDIVLAYETLEQEAARQGKPIRDHVTHLFLHGLLHLLGYDHETDADAKVMETKERNVLAAIGLPDPYSDEH
jgi:probable rRNA maturation factor